MKHIFQLTECLKAIKLASIFFSFFGLLAHSFAQDNMVLNSAVVNGGNSIDILWPTINDYSMPAGNMSINQYNQEPYVNRAGFVKLNTDLFIPKFTEDGKAEDEKPLFHGLQMNLYFFSGQSSMVVIDSESISKDGIISVTGHPFNEPLGTFLITITPERYLITLQEIETSTIYNVVGNTRTSTGLVKEIDLLKIPPKLE